MVFPNGLCHDFWIPELTQLMHESSNALHNKRTPSGLDHNILMLIKILTASYQRMTNLVGRPVPHTRFHSGTTLVCTCKNKSKTLLDTASTEVEICVNNTQMHGTCTHHSALTPSTLGLHTSTSVVVKLEFQKQ